MVERIQVTVNGTVYDVEVKKPDSLNGQPLEVRVNGRPYTVHVGRAAAAPAPAPSVSSTPTPAPMAPQPPSKAAAPGSAQGQHVTAPMPGKILSVLVAVGDRVQAKQALCTLEAMKMEMTIATPVAGTVAEVRAQVGENAAYGDLLFVIDESRR